MLIIFRMYYTASIEGGEIMTEKQFMEMVCILAEDVDKFEKDVYSMQTLGDIARLQKESDRLHRRFDECLKIRNTLYFAES